MAVGAHPSLSLSGFVRRGEEVQRVKAGEAAGGSEGQVQTGGPQDEEGHAEEEGQRDSEEEPEARAEGEKGAAAATASAGLTSDDRVRVLFINECYYF